MIGKWRWWWLKMMKKALVICFWDIQKKKLTNNIFISADCFHSFVFVVVCWPYEKQNKTKLSHRMRYFDCQKTTAKTMMMILMMTMFFFVWLFFPVRKSSVVQYIFLFCFCLVFLLNGFLADWMDGCFSSIKYSFYQNNGLVVFLILIADFVRFKISKNNNNKRQKTRV